MMQAVIIHYIIAKNLHNPKETAETSNNEISVELQNSSGCNYHYNESLGHYQKSMQAETGIK